VAAAKGWAFAIPAVIVNFDYQNLRKYGHVQRVAPRREAQNITPTLADGWAWRGAGELSSPTRFREEWRKRRGLQVQDIVRPLTITQSWGLPDFMAALYLHPADQVLKIDVLRGMSRMSFKHPREGVPRQRRGV